ncbi:MAG: CDP-glycerol glycerophosphotransferase family protein [Bacteroidales bacterium]|nr:CDP-glycerol glycerophosphotransferase family protein [Bacteroidales bacterium]
MLKFIAYLLGYIAFPFSFMVPRSRKKTAFGSFRGGFDGNAKYLFIEMSERGEDVVWLSSSRATVKHVRGLGLRADWVFSPKGAWRALRSRTWFVNAYTSDILWMLSGGAHVVNLWHGVGLKRTEYNSTTGPMYDRYIRKTFGQAFFHPEAYRKPQYLVTASDFQTPMFASAFRMPESRCIKCGYPRNKILVCGEEERQKHIAAYEPEPVKAFLERLKGFKELWIYMPTWRDSQREVFAQNMDLTKLNSALEKRGAALLLKPHPNTVPVNLYGLPNVITIDPDVDVYPLLPYTDVLITDYSSALYDYILMDGKKVVLYLYDYSDYVKDREFYFPFDENVIGQRAGNFEELLSIVKNGPEPLDGEKREALIHKFWGSNPVAYDFSNYLHL